VGRNCPPAPGPDSFSFLPVLEGRNPPTADSRSDRDAGGQFAGHDDPIRRLETDQSARLRRILKPKTIQPGPGDPAGQLYNLRADLAETKIST
jgi:arylsulfatase A